MLVSITFVLVNITCIGEHNMWWLVLHVLVSITCVGEYNICAGEYNMCWSV